MKLPFSTITFLVGATAWCTNTVTTRRNQIRLDDDGGVLYSTRSAAEPAANSFLVELFDKTETTTAITPPPPSSSSSKSNSLTELSNLLKAAPKDLLRLDVNEEGVRGVFLNRNIRKDEIILKVPLKSCLRDDEAPEWIQGEASNPHEWRIRLAASFLETQLSETRAFVGFREWYDMLPDPDVLRASLPVHWTGDMLSNAKCTALELLVDGAFFNREGAMEILCAGLDKREGGDAMSAETKRQLCSNALDVVETRSCRVETVNSQFRSLPLRLVAPVFDFVNHGSNRCVGDGSSNAYFLLEQERTLVVRARHDLDSNAEVLIDYGDSTRPAWRCLATYGFVPKFSEQQILEEEDELEEEGQVDNIAELFVGGRRYEVGPSFVPMDLVAAAADGRNTENVELTSQIAQRLAERMYDAACSLEVQTDESTPNLETPHAYREVLSEQLAVSLRRSQHEILKSCAQGLELWAQESLTTEFI